MCLCSPGWHCSHVLFIGRESWLSDARVQAIAGSCPRSHDSAKSGMRFWKWFAVFILGMRGNVLPPSLAGLLQWSRLFRNHKVFGNYLSYVKLACELVGCDIDVFRHPSLRRAKTAILKRRLMAPRIPTWIGVGVVGRLVSLMQARPQLRHMSMLFLAAYAFLLRVPSEGLTLAAHAAPPGHTGPVFKLEADGVTIEFQSRKNRLWPSRQTRKCWCRKCRLTCPVCVLGAFFRALPSGARPFAHLKPAQVLLALRDLLEELGIPHARVYRTHDFRRGHAEDLRRCGARLYEILAAGDWSSAAFILYLDKEGLERDAVAEANAGFSDSEPDSE